MDVSKYLNIKKTKYGKYLNDNTTLHFKIIILIILTYIASSTQSFYAIWT